MSSDAELEEIRKRRLLELQRQIAQDQAATEQRENVELQKHALLRRILTVDARQRLNRIKLVKPDFAAQLELQLLQLAQSGRIRLPINDEQLKALLIRLQPAKRDITFRRV